MQILKLTDEKIDEISKEWSKLPDDIRDKYKNVYFNMVDKRLITNHGYKLITDLIKQNNPNSETKENNIQYVDYNEGQFKYMDKLYSMNHPNKFILDLINKAKKNGKLSKKEDYFLMYYLQKGETPYSAKLLPNNY